MLKGDRGVSDSGADHIFGSPAGDFKGGRNLKTDEKSSDPGDGAGPNSREIERMKRGENHRGIEHANQLKSMGLNVYATVAPICPGIIDLEPILEKLDTEIPVYVDSLQCAKDSIQEKRVMEWIQRDYPELLGVYESILMKKDISYFEEILKTYGTDARVKTFPYDLKV